MYYRKPRRLQRSIDAAFIQAADESAYLLEAAGSSRVACLICGGGYVHSISIFSLRQPQFYYQRADSICSRYLVEREIKSDQKSLELLRSFYYIYVFIIISILDYL